MSSFDFDAPINRRDVPALKTHKIVLDSDGAQLFPGGVADMDFAVAPPIQNAMRKRLEHGVFGYEAVPDGLFPALQDWYARRHGWNIPPDQILRAPNALNALAIATSLFSAHGDGIIVQPPVFFDFFDIIRENKRSVVCNPLINAGNRYEMDFDGLELLAKDPRSTLLFLCNPHNPVGRVWSKDELKTLNEICLRHNVRVITDELHGDIVRPGHRYIPFATVSPEAAANSITILSPAKTFNIASCCSAFTIVPDATCRAAVQVENSRLTVNKNNAFANVAMEAAFREGEPWLKAAVEYIDGNLSVLRDVISGIPGVEMVEPEATFLVWLDFRGLNMAPEDLHLFLRERAGMALTRGVSFGQEGAGFMRLNIACRRIALQHALDGLSAAVADR